jgi:ketosteroid isomerase-like protein
MSEENVEVVRGLLERFAAGEVVWDALDEEVEIHDHDILDAGEYRGREGVLRWIEDWSSGLPAVDWDLQEILDAGETVMAVILLKARGRGSSVEVERQDAIVYRLRHGKIVRFDYYNSRRQGLQAAGLAE